MEAEAFTGRLLRKLSQACTLEELLDDAAASGLEAISVCDAAYNLLVPSHLTCNDNVFVVQQSNRQIMRPEIVEEIQAKGISQKLQSSPEPFWFYNNSIGQWEIFCSVLYGGQVLGYLFQRREEEPKQEVIPCWSALAQAVAVVIQRSGGVEPDAGRQMQENVLLQLALGQLTDPEIAQARLEQSGWAPLSSYRLGCLFTNEVSLFAALRPEQLSAQLRNVFPGCICCCYKERILVLGPGSLDVSRHGETRIRLRHWLNYHHFHIAASAPYTKLTETATAYAQARELVHAGRAMAQNGTLPEIISYEEHLPTCACLSAYGADVLPLHIHPHILRLVESDREHHTKYIETLTAYFACGRSMTETSKALFIHKTTLFYRFERMEKLVGPFLKEPKKLFLYEYSLTLLQELTLTDG